MNALKYYQGDDDESFTCKPYSFTREYQQLLKNFEERIIMNKEIIIKSMHHFNSLYKPQGFMLYSLFGSYARGTQDMFSDIDFTYKIDHDIFFKDNAFGKLAKIQEIKQELEQTLHKKIDLIPANTKNHLIQEQLKKEQIAI